MVDDDPLIFEHGVFANIELKIRDANLQVKEFDTRIQQIQQFIDNKIVLLDRQVKESADSLASIGEFKDFVKGELANQSNKLVSSTGNIFANFDHLNADIAALTTTVHDSASEAQSLSLTTLKSEQRTKETMTALEQRTTGFEGSLRELKVSA